VPPHGFYSDTAGRRMLLRSAPVSDLIFNGVTVFCREEPQTWTPPLLAIRPHKSQFTFIVLAPERLVSAEPVPDPRFTHWRVEFRGEFSRTNDPPVRVVGPMADRDAQGMCQALAARYGLPRTPTAVAPHEVAQLPADSFVTITGCYRPGHNEVANFEGVMVHDERLVAGQSFRITGFTRPGNRAVEPGMPRVVGYSGPEVRAVAVEPI